MNNFDLTTRTPSRVKINIVVTRNGQIVFTKVH